MLVQQSLFDHNLSQNSTQAVMMRQSSTNSPRQNLMWVNNFNLTATVTTTNAIDQLISAARVDNIVTYIYTDTKEYIKWRNPGNSRSRKEQGSLYQSKSHLQTGWDLCRETWDAGLPGFVFKFIVHPRNRQWIGSKNQGNGSTANPVCARQNKV